MRRRGVTLIELLVAFSLFSLLGTLVWQFRSSASRQGKHMEEISDLMRASMVLQEMLTTDLEAALPLRVLPEAERARGQDLGELILPVYSGYRGADPDSVRYTPIRYRFDAETRRVLRNGKPIRLEGIARATFRWTDARPTILLLKLESEKSFRRVGSKLEIRLPAPQGTDGLPIWRFARHHRQAVREGSP